MKTTVLFLVLAISARLWSAPEWGPWVVTWQTNGRFILEGEGLDRLIRPEGPVRGYVARRVVLDSNALGRYWALTVDMKPNLEAPSRAEAYVLGRNAEGQTVLYSQLGKFSNQSILFKKLVFLPPGLTSAELGVKIDDMAGTCPTPKIKWEPFTPGEAANKTLPQGETLWGVTAIDRAYGLPVFPMRLKDTALKLMACAGVNATRSGVRWETIEASPGVKVYTNLEMILTNNLAYGISVPILCLGGTPSWASGKNPETHMAPETRKKLGEYKVRQSFWAPTNWSLWDEYVKGVAVACKGRVKAFEIINEPDLSSEGFQGSYEDYRKYLQVAFHAVKKVDPKLKVFTGAFVYDSWLPRLYADGDAAFFDGVCSHPYAATGMAVAVRNGTLWAQGDFLGSPKEVWVTEVGFQSGWKEGPGKVKTEEIKAQEGEIALRELAKQSALVTWYTAHEPGAMFGLTRLEKNQSLRVMPMYERVAAVTGKGVVTNGSMVAQMAGPQTLKPGDKAEFTIAVTNKGPAVETLSIWLVGWVDDLGPSHGGPRDLDQTLSLKPGQFKEIKVALKPLPSAKGVYQIGFALMGTKGNQFIRRDLTVE